MKKRGTGVQSMWECVWRWQGRNRWKQIYTIHYISLIIWKCYLKSKHVICQRQLEDLTSSPQVTPLKLHQTQKHQILSSHTNSTSACRCLEMRVMARTNNRPYSQRISFTNGWPVWHFYLLLFLTPLPPHLRLFHFTYEEYPEEAILH